VIAVLLASARVTRGDLQVAVLVRTNPDIRPRRRNHERAKPIDRFARANDVSVRVDVRKPATLALTSNTRHRIGNVSEARGSRGPHVLVRDRLTQFFLLGLARDGHASCREAERRGVGYGRDKGVAATGFCALERWTAPIAGLLRRRLAG